MNHLRKAIMSEERGEGGKAGSRTTTLVKLNIAGGFQYVSSNVISWRVISERTRPPHINFREVTYAKWLTRLPPPILSEV